VTVTLPPLASTSVPLGTTIEPIRRANPGDPGILNVTTPETRVSSTLVASWGVSGPPVLGRSVNW